MSKTKTDKVKVSFYLEKKINEKLKIEADSQGRTATELLKEATIRLLKDYKVE